MLRDKVKKKIEEIKADFNLEKNGCIFAKQCAKI